MFHLDYELLDVGHGRRLERFGRWILDRPCSAAETMIPLFPEKWTQADAVFETENHFVSESNSSSDFPTCRGYWKWRSTFVADPFSRCTQRESSATAAKCTPCWVCSAESMQFEIACTPFGHVGLFPEQQANWNRIGRYCREFYDTTGVPCRVLNLFSYTGGSTLAAASQGGHVVHVDSASSVVDWARRNAALSQLQRAPIRWIVDDAVKFVQRERKRQKTYDLVILDPPSYGHGRGTAVWQLQRDLFPLLCDCSQLVAESPNPAMLVSCHTTGYTAEHLCDHLREAVHTNMAASTNRIEMFEMTIPITATPRHFSAGVAAFFVLNPVSNTM